ncbi:MAG: hypothetical protein CL816_06220 [Coxiellaceae bacterium]|nr:hypothetical protein [Coxiellaceae bacterium]|tara:strand:- start:434 stop:625 length:192 start_codon:yes stop_codon:yes gene_type:complete
MYGINDANHFLNAKAKVTKVTFSSNDRDDVDGFSKDLGEKSLPEPEKVLIREDLNQNPVTRKT